MRIQSAIARIPPESMTFVHAGPVVLRERSALASLRHYLRVCAEDRLVLVHRGRAELHAAAERAEVPEIELDKIEASLDENAAAAELAVELGATSVEFAIDRPGLSRPGGRRIQELTVREAERLARTAALPERIRRKLLAAANAVRRGLLYARIGGPLALLRNSATVVYPDAAVQVGMPSPELVLPAAQATARPLAAHSLSKTGPTAERAMIAPGVERRPRHRIMSCSPVERAVVLEASA